MKCVHCGKEFEPTNARQKYCSRRCKMQSYYTRNREQCKAKVKAYYAANREACLQRTKKYRVLGRDWRAIKMKCEYCGAEFTKRRSWQRYCSVKCRNAAYAPTARQNSSKYYQEHREEISANREPYRAASRKYYAANRADLLFKNKKYRVTGEWPHGGTK